MPSEEINYSLGVLIVLLLLFYFVCKCIGQNEYHRLQERERFNGDDTTLIYGNSPMILSKSPIPYIRKNATNITEVPSSKSAMRHLFDVEEYKCGQDNVFDNKKDNEMSTLYMKKKEVEKFKIRPKGLTQERRHHNIDRNDRLPMPSY